MIDALLYETCYSGYGYVDEDEEMSEDAELILEQLVFSAIKKIKTQRHKCDPYYDEEFEGYDCKSKKA